MAVGKGDSFLPLTLRQPDEFNAFRTLSSIIPLSELSTIQGNRYYVEFDGVLDPDEEVYIKYQMPSAASGFVVALQNRIFKSLNGEAEMEILWDTTGGTLGATLPSFNENRNSAKTGRMIVNLFTVAPTGGTVRETDFVSGVGTGAGSSGDISPSLGFRLYSPDSDFVFHVTNTHNLSNRIHISYTWYELPLALFDFA